MLLNIYPKIVSNLDSNSRNSWKSLYFQNHKMVSGIRLIRFRIPLDVIDL